MERGPIRVRPPELHQPGHRWLVLQPSGLAGQPDRQRRTPVVAAVGRQDLHPSRVALRQAHGVLDAFSPALVKNTFSKWPSSRSAPSRPRLAFSTISRAASLRWSFANGGATMHSVSTWSLIAWIIVGCWCPRFMLTSIDVKSIHSLPAGSQNFEPSAPAITVGSSAPCADHEWNTQARSLA